ncbi:ADP-ribose pyrophosphatase YjhB, NUDIX family [Amycolatopsis pretoriensis]|uniref:ADP-ribose pyrophosphatase YjhB, NUDIX family n=1 Tax=Amycolatopsis pretoriensis TaxID=218821 RepID=A0A1H5QV80_9PSEU|nr:NUDIX domain-containing protein [Amycolatopsis pretoriensis]SEF29231.1 ADP-ribose pyrophosphatase YjhB, NUDIX family [Amycolatopsis pretoriensis]
MRDLDGEQPASRTLLEQLIRERRQTFEEFAEFAETFAREHDEPGTLSVRHLSRLVAGAHPDGRPLGAVRPATARLLEHIFGLSIDELLAPLDRLTATALQPLRVAIAVVVRGSEVLIVCRRAEDANGLDWQFPAGVVKPGGRPAVIAVRETLAETDVHCIVTRKLGTRLHPTTGVLCEYVLCDYVAGEARNVDVVENVAAIWVERADLTRFVPADQIYGPVLRALDILPTPTA